MDGFKNLEINNFRGIEHLRIDDFSYMIENKKLKGHQAYKYTYEGLAEACENDVELRGRLIQ